MRLEPTPVPRENIARILCVSEQNPTVFENYRHDAVSKAMIWSATHKKMRMLGSWRGVGTGGTSAAGQNAANQVDVHLITFNSFIMSTANIMFFTHIKVSSIACFTLENSLTAYEKESQ